MPIFKDPDRQSPYVFPPRSHDQSHPDVLPSLAAPAKEIDSFQDQIMTDAIPDGPSTESQNRPTLQTSDRDELIRSIKRGESPTWVPSPSLEKYFAAHGDAPQTRLEELQKRTKLSLSPDEDILLPLEQSASSEGRSSSNLSLDLASEIERPRSALHSGDFHERSPHAPTESEKCCFVPQSNLGMPAASPTIPWASQENQPYSFQEPPSSPQLERIGFLDSFSQLRASSFGSNATNYVLKPATSPLVQQANNPDLDLPPGIESFELAPSSAKANRRRTLPPDAFQASSQNQQWNHTNRASSVLPHREGLFSYQGHRPRKSLTSGFSLQPTSSPQNSFISRSRRMSHSSEATLSYHASMVGSFEESILRGRMSMSPSRPLDFTAQIGVLGKGDCKPGLKCPLHVTVSFPAVFYSYPASGGGRTISDDNPSPYVGYIDVENSFPKENRRSRKGSEQISIPPKCSCPHNINEERIAKFQTRGKRSGRRSQSPKSPPGGCYRIPQQGQLQIVIKNPNKTAVKLFLVPYDLEGMEPGTKTFIRQRSYSVSTMSDMTVSAQENNSQAQYETTNDKPILRYLVHFNICCPSKGRFYLYSGIRVVFANRVPDGKEKLKNELHYPEPRYSPYRPTKGVNSCVIKTYSDTASKGPNPEVGFELGSQGFLNLADFGPSKMTPLASSAKSSALPIYHQPSNNSIPMEMNINPIHRPLNTYQLDSLDFPYFYDESLRSQASNTLTDSRPCEEIRSKFRREKDFDSGRYIPTPTLNNIGSGSLLAQKLRGFQDRHFHNK
ncbi:hypothetical protein LOZ12_001209 [Ophidiomyces ophidiicola]|uniref:Uncharacterized protein n=1 Tax=Ophidiomyces ophidiicola TaxID=1387563 RepID=A0ACB8V2W9_9EURO|nr:hypothetical protein LOZ64_001561 [Ophidiomyces ophidiicola]KAI1950223.1 hypothetical protein LOZ62_001969 [Ophidiomyces ophidiicola]KAI1972957.1 hypothetical protein LOZ56_002152 [Ophidiomyces ophidiicola]KAI2005259.1 hypothetical protein LOZ49_005495 [Ophidiomyces ophidiicola]KAI2008558.1 hypothetical protein LOZ50_002025 [Ophidiomyces ophidiicola]